MLRWRFDAHCGPWRLCRSLHASHPLWETNHSHSYSPSRTDDPTQQSQSIGSRERDGKSGSGGRGGGGEGILDSDDSPAAMDAAFFQWCAQTVGMQTKKLAIDTTMPITASLRAPHWNECMYDLLDPRTVNSHPQLSSVDAKPLRRELQASMHIAPQRTTTAILEEAAAAGAVLASVPYTSAVVNAETIRGKQSYASQRTVDEEEKDANSFPKIPLVMPSVGIMLSVLQHPKLRRLLKRAVRRGLSSRRAARHRSGRSVLQAALRARPLDGMESQVFWLACFVACVLRQQRVAQAAHLPQLSTYYDSYINTRLFCEGAPSPFVYLAASTPSAATIVAIRDALRRATNGTASGQVPDNNVECLLYVTPIGQDIADCLNGDDAPQSNQLQDAGQLSASALLEYPALREGVIGEAAERAAKYYRVLSEAENRLNGKGGNPSPSPTAAEGKPNASAARGRQIREALKTRNRQLRAAQLALHDGLTDIFRDTHEQLCLTHVLLRIYNAAKRMERRRRSRLWSILNHQRVKTVSSSRFPIRETVLIPSLDEMWNAHLLVMKKAVFLPLHCATSAPLDLSEFLAQLEERSMDRASSGRSAAHSVPPLLPSLVPIVDMFGSESVNGRIPSVSSRAEYSPRSRAAASAAAQAEYLKLLESIAANAGLNHGGGAKSGGNTTTTNGHTPEATTQENATLPSSNASLYTCIASTFATDSGRTDGNTASASVGFQSTPTRRRVMPVESTQLSSRRVAVCASVAIKRGERVCIPYGSDVDVDAPHD